MKTIGERIQQARLAKGWSADYLAKKVGYQTQSGISNLENKATGSGGNKIGKIAFALDVTLDWLLTGPDSDNVPFLPPKLEQQSVEHQTTTVNSPPGIYVVQSESKWPFDLFDYSDWMLLPEKDRHEFENLIAGAVQRSRKLRAST